MDLRYRLAIGGLALDVLAQKDVDLTAFTARAVRYARPDGVPADETLEVSAVDALPIRVAPTRALEGDTVRIEAAGTTVWLGLAPGRARATVASGTHNFAFENTLRILLSRRLVQTGGVMLHAAALRDGELAVAFPGVSGAGKSTLTLRHPENGRISEDLVALRPGADGRFVVMSLPFIAFHELDLGPTEAPLSAFAFPRHDTRVSVTPLGRRAVVAALARTVVSFAPDGLEELILNRLLALAQAVPGFELNVDRTSPYWPQLRSELALLATRRTTWAA